MKLRNKTDKKFDWSLDIHIWVVIKKKSKLQHLILKIPALIERRTHTESLSVRCKRNLKNALMDMMKKSFFCMNTLLLSSIFNSFTDPVKKECGGTLYDGERLMNNLWNDTLSPLIFHFSIFWYKMTIMKTILLLSSNTFLFYKIFFSISLKSFSIKSFLIHSLAWL